MKSIKTILAALVLAMPLALTSCEGSLDDVFGEWDKPAPQVPSTVVEEAKVLGAALETGATVTINYTVGGINYVAVFKKESDDTYTLISNTTPSTARAMTRAVDPRYVPSSGDYAPKLNIVGDKLQLIVYNSLGTPLFEASMNIAGGEVVVNNINFAGIDSTIGSMNIDDKAAEIKNPEMAAVTLHAEGFIPSTTRVPVLSGELNYSIKYSKDNNETWADVVARYSTLVVAEIKTENDFISMKFTEDFVKDALKGMMDESLIARAASAISGMTFYVVSNNPYALTARGMTRATDSYVKTTDVVGTQDTYYLTTNEPSN